MGCAAKKPSPPGEPSDARYEGSRRDALAPARELAPVDRASLPAGLYFRNGYVRCEGCPTPRWALTTGVLTEVEAARRSLLWAKERSEPDGFPLVLHTDELIPLDRSREGIVVVLGLYERETQARAAAERWASTPVEPIEPIEPIELMDPEDALEIELGGGEAQWQARRFVVQLDAEEAVDAYPPAEIREGEQWLSEQVWRSYEEYRERRAAMLESLPVRCQIPPDRVFVSTAGRYDDDGIYAPYDWQPAACEDGRPAYVRQTDTRRHSIVRPGPGPGPTSVIEQVILVECDSPTIERWPWAHGRRERGTPVLLASRGSCGAP
ncbi:MAG: hypothetical protein KDK70_05940 [Myxococcales bacterium]|nr:hypothetical protein [Myxococcales bacterium]